MRLGRCPPRALAIGLLVTSLGCQEPQVADGPEFEECEHHAFFMHGEVDGGFVDVSWDILDHYEFHNAQSESPETPGGTLVIGNGDERVTFSSLGRVTDDQPKTVASAAVTTDMLSAQNCNTESAASILWLDSFDARQGRFVIRGLSTACGAPVLEGELEGCFSDHRVK